jgi:PTS system fructose-specific IIC component
LLVALLLILGTAAGTLARAIRLPSLTGQIVLGIVLGESFLNLLPGSNQMSFDPLITLAVSFVAVSVGGHLEWRRIHNAVRRILLIASWQVAMTFASVFAAFHLFNPFGLEGAHQLPVHLLVASIATSTSPVSTLHIIKEKKARGLLVKTTIAVVAVNNLLTIVLFAICRSVSSGILSTSRGALTTLLPSMLAVGLSLVIGTLIGGGLILYCRRVLVTRKGFELGGHERGYRQAALFTGLFVAMCLAAGLCEFISQQAGSLGLHPPPILANLAVGLVLANGSHYKEELLSLFGVLESMVFTLFFVLAGSHLRLDAARAVAAAAAIYIGSRMAAKFLGGFVGALASRSTGTVSRHIGSMLQAQGAIAIALVIVLGRDPVLAEFESLITACVLSGVVVSELAAGPLISRGLVQAREEGRDRTRLIEFLQEEYMLPRVYAKDKWSVIEQLAFFMKRVHRIELSHEELLEAFRRREEDVSTALGRGIAVPHAIIPEGDQIYGVLALLDPPVEFDAPDNEPVRFVVLIATPEQMVRKHLEVIAALARMMRNMRIRESLFNARTAEEIHEIIQSEEAETFNYFVET